MVLSQFLRSLQVIVGAYETEPEPLPVDYYIKGEESSGFDYEFHPLDNGRSQDDGYCMDGSTYPGEIFFWPPTMNPENDRLVYAYEQPVSDLMVPNPAVVPVMSPLVALDKSPSSNGGDTGGETGITYKEWIARGGAYEPCDCPCDYECIPEDGRRKLFGNLGSGGTTKTPTTTTATPACLPAVGKTIPDNCKPI